MNERTFIKDSIDMVNARKEAVISRGDEGLALVMSLITLVLFSLIGLYLTLNATTEIRISDNDETHIKARYAAVSGLRHAEELLRGLDFNDQLNGPDGTHDSNSQYFNHAKSPGYRNPMDWATARVLDIADPLPFLQGASDDGLINTGSCAGTAGRALIPLVGIPLNVPATNGNGTALIARYFVKVADNNNDPLERALDPLDDPFLDGDGTIIIRAAGLAQTILEQTDRSIRRNSVAVLEAKVRRRSTFDPGAAVVILGREVRASGLGMYHGDSFAIHGDATRFGIAAVDPDGTDGISPYRQLMDDLAPGQEDNVLGAGKIPSVEDLTSRLPADPDRALLLDGEYIREFAGEVIPRIADCSVAGDQFWTTASAPAIGRYDPMKAPNAPGQDPKVTLVGGDLCTLGQVEGGGVLVLRGKLTVYGRFRFNGIMLLIGEGNLDASAGSLVVTGGIFLVSLGPNLSAQPWGEAFFSVGDASSIRSHEETIRAALRLLPAVRLGMREISSSMDP